MKYRPEKIYPTMQAAANILAKNCPENAILIESGTYLGNCAALFVKTLVDAGNTTFKLYTIDNFQFDNIPWQQKQIDNWPNGYDAYLENIKELGVEPYITTIVKDCIEAIADFEDKSVNFLFLDDNHDGEWVDRELSLYIPKMASDSIIFGDDYEGSLGVKNAFHKYFGSKAQPVEGGVVVYL